MLLAYSLTIRASASLFPVLQFFWSIVFDRPAPTRKAGIGHHIGVYVKGVVLMRRIGAHILSISLQLPALRLVVKVCDHDVIKNLPVHCWVLDRAKDLDTSVEIARHKVCGRYVDLRLRVGQ